MNQRIGSYVIHVSFALLLIASVALAQYMLGPVTDRVARFANSHKLDSLAVADPAQGTNQALGYATLKSESRLADLFDARLALYRQRMFDFNASLVSQLILAATALTIMIRPGSSVKLPVVGLSIDIKYVHAALPVCMAYFWMRFGYALNALIEDRVALWRLSEALEPGLDTLRSVSLQGWTDVLSTFSARTLLRDFGVMDGWFIMYRPEFVEKVAFTPWTMQSIVILYGIFYAAIHGCMLALIWRSAHRFAGTSIVWWLVHFAYFALAALFLGFTHLEFHFQGGHPNNLQSGVVVLGVILGWALTGFHEREVPERSHARTRTTHGKTDGVILEPVENR